MARAWMKRLPRDTRNLLGVMKVFFCLDYSNDFVGIYIYIYIHTHAHTKLTKFYTFIMYNLLYVKYYLVKKKKASFGGFFLSMIFTI